MLIVGHAGVSRAILCHLLGIPLANLFRLGQDYGSLSIIDNEKGEMRLVAMNLTPEFYKEICQIGKKRQKEFN